jgi:hypothetical protein
MEYRYPANTPSMYISYFRNREGPNGILVYYKNESRFVNTSKELRAVFGPAKFTESIKAASKWADEMIEQYGKSQEEEGRADTSFASEAEAEEKTRMVI